MGEWKPACAALRRGISKTRIGDHRSMTSALFGPSVTHGLTLRYNPLVTKTFMQPPQWCTAIRINGRHLATTRRQPIKLTRFFLVATPRPETA